RLLEGAVEHGATLMRDRLQAIVPADMLLSDDARARGFRLEGYGVFFDVEVPALEGTLLWSFRTLDQNDLGLQSALKTLRTFVQRAGNDVAVQQALKRVELQVSPISMTASLQSDPSQTASVEPKPSADLAAAGGVDPVSRPDGAPDQPAAAQPGAVQPGAGQSEPDVFSDPVEAYRTEIREALIEAMLEHSRSLGIGRDEWLTVAARRRDDRPQLGVDTEARTVVISVRGSDLDAFLAGELTRQEARDRVEVRVF
ncbi:MAG: hypothetical protein AB7J63_06310, partial [Vicinamibacterales bacterium]